MRHTHLIQTREPRDLAPNPIFGNPALQINSKMLASNSISPMTHLRCRCIPETVDTRHTAMKIPDIPRMAMQRMIIKDIPWNSHQSRKIQMHFLIIRLRTGQVMIKVPNQHLCANTAVLRV